MIQIHSAPFTQGTARVTIAAGANLDDALARFGEMDDCIGCEVALATTHETPDASLEGVARTFAPRSRRGPVLRPGSAASGLLRRGRWVEVDVDDQSQRLRSVKLPAALIGAQRLIAVNDLRGDSQMRPTVAIGLWALFAHPIVRAGARLAGEREGLTAEIALAVHPDRYVLIESDRQAGLALVIATVDPVAADLLVLALREGRARASRVGPWEDPLVQAATELDLGVRTYEQIDIDAVVSPALSSEQQELAATILRAAAEAIGVHRAI